MHKIRSLVSGVRIRSLIYILMTIMLVCFIALEGAYLLNMHAVYQESTSQLLDMTLAQLSETAARFHVHMDELGKGLAFNTAANAFIHSNNAVDWLLNYEPLVAVINSALIADRTLYRIIYSDLNLLNVGATSHNDYVLIQTLSDDMRSGKLDVSQPKHLRVGGQSVYVRQSGYNRDRGKQFYLIIVYGDEVFANAIAAVSDSSEQVLTLLNDRSEVIVRGERSIPLSSSLEAELSDTVEDGVFRAEGCVAAVRGIPGTEWRWISVTKANVFNENFGEYARFTFMVTGTLILLLALASALIQWSITRPILRVNRFLSDIGGNYNTCRLALPQRNEIGELSEKLNAMLDKIGAMNREIIKAQQQIYESRIEKQSTELYSLYSQINPHFLYNTLDCIRSIAALNQVEPIVKMTSSMVKIFRYSIKTRTYVRVREEMDCIFEYMRILQIRYRNVFTEDYDIDESCRERLIPKMVLQPIVENAVFHGLEQSRKPGVLRINGRVCDSDNTLRFTISDNGRGMDEEQLTALSNALKDNSIGVADTQEDKKSIGLRNINARIRLHFGSVYGIKVESSPNNGTRVLVTLPALEFEDTLDSLG
jgi:two-component system sensor histidine kinase YesM